MALQPTPEKLTDLTRAAIWARQLRLEQWIKNGFVLAPLIFGMRLGDARALLRVALTFGAFCLAASGSYILNDLHDLREDSNHPEKRLRPLAAGAISRHAAVTAMLFFLLASLAAAYRVSTEVFLALLAYFGLNVAYSVALKRIVILDVLVLASGYVVRVLAGAAAADVSASPWVLTATFFIALVLGFGKRRAEMASLSDGANESRSVLARYTLPVLDMFIEISAASTVITYALYVVESETAAHLGSSNLLLTLPCVIFGLFRYLYILRTVNSGSNPTKLVLTDLPLGVTILVWGAIVLALLYWP